MDATDLTRLLARAVAGAARRVESRPSDGSFLERTLEDAVASQLPGSVGTAQQRRRWKIDGFEPAPFGVDIEWRIHEELAGIEVKVTDVGDSLFDVIKLAIAQQQARIDIGFCVIAATERQWQGGGPVTRMARPSSQWLTWTASDLIDGPSGKAVLVESGPRPTRAPAEILSRGICVEEMPNVPNHRVAAFAVKSGSAERLPLPT